MRGVQSHLEARDGAEFHEQHLEFRLHHVGRAPGEEVGDGRLVWSVSKWRDLPKSLYHCFRTVIYVSGSSMNPHLLKKVGPVNLLLLLDGWLSRKRALQTQYWRSSGCRHTDTSVLLSPSVSCSSAVATVQSPGGKQRAEYHILQKNVKTFTIHSFGRVTLHNRPTGTWETGRCEQSKLRCGNFSGQHVETKQSGGLGVFLLWAGFSVCARGFICRLLDLLRVRRSAAFLDVSLCCPADSAERQKEWPQHNSSPQSPLCSLSL